MHFHNLGCIKCKWNLYYHRPQGLKYTASLINAHFSPMHISNKCGIDYIFNGCNTAYCTQWCFSVAHDFVMRVWPTVFMLHDAQTEFAHTMTVKATAMLFTWQNVPQDLALLHSHCALHSVRDVLLIATTLCHASFTITKVTRNSGSNY